MWLTDGDYAEIDGRLAAHDAFLRGRYRGERAGRQPVHTVYIPADRLDGFRDWGAIATKAMEERAFGRPGTPADVGEKLPREPIEDLRVYLEDGYGVRDDDQEDRAV